MASVRAEKKGVPAPPRLRRFADLLIAYDSPVLHLQTRLDGLAVRRPPREPPRWPSG